MIHLNLENVTWDREKWSDNEKYMLDWIRKQFKIVPIAQRSHSVLSYHRKAVFYISSKEMRAI